ncbi:MAG: tRNA (N(6)-L-threonylcarbamoyladenosine(37)-C(2))-methylthiotransferase MtaB [Desulfuromonas sp.]|nr:MAG: tRNA (N(6)-L-threonylcarbamoyladenosine(37)-C(2))-methylthiotransferase MtaB [Desulfuromonas sp.]
MEDGGIAFTAANHSLTVAFATLGCKTNQFETAAMQQQVVDAGYQVVPFAAGADLVVVNTCTVTSATDSQSRNLIRRARRLNPASRVVVTGCYAQVDPQTLAAIPGVSVVIGNQEKGRLLDFLKTDPPAKAVAVSDSRSAGGHSLSAVSSFAGRSRAFVQVQNGCDAFCTYCIIPYARGPSRSVTAEEVLSQVQTLVKKGFNEVVLTGIHVGGYGKDLSPSIDLIDLTQRIAQQTKVRRVRLGSIEPMEIPDRLVELVADSQVVCPHFHVPLQSGDNQVLQRMGRNYDSEMFRERIMAIHRSIPDVGIGLDMITGFPGESEAEFNNSLALIDSLPISYLHVFPYSRRPGTPAAEFPDQVPGAVSRSRAERLRRLAATKQEQFARRFVGSNLELIVEGQVESGHFKGVARNYLSVSFRGDDDLRGQLVWVKVTGFERGGLVGELVSS